MKKILIALLLVTTPTYASLIELKEVRVDYMDFFNKGRDPLITENGLLNRELGKELDVTINVDLFKYGYWRSLVHSMTDSFADTHDNGQFRLVGLNMEVGIRLAPFLDVYYWHYSQHLLDYTYPYGAFPVADAIGIHLYLFRSDNKESLFNVH